MKLSLSVLTFLLAFVSAATQLRAQESEAERLAFETVKAKAEHGDTDAQYNLGISYDEGKGVAASPTEALKWFRKAADGGSAQAQWRLGSYYLNGNLGLKTNATIAVEYFLKSAHQGNEHAQYCLSECYQTGNGVAANPSEAARWLRAAANQGDGLSMFFLAARYKNGDGVPKDYIEAYKWYNLASSSGNGLAKSSLEWLENQMTIEQIAEAQRLSREFKPRTNAAQLTVDGAAESLPLACGTGFFATQDGFLITNEHVVKGASRIHLLTKAGTVDAKVVKSDTANDLALLKAEGKFSALPITPSRSVKLGATVATVGFPNIGLQGFAPKLAKGEIASLTGAADDPRYFQISVPVQPGNSGGALVDERGNVVGVVSAKLSARAALATSGALPENVNYAIKSSFLLSFLESVPEVVAQLREPETKERKFEDVVKSSEEAAVLVIVY